MGEWKDPTLSVKLALPLSVEVHFGDLDGVADLQPEGRCVVRAGVFGLLHSGVARHLSL